jgi:hypothetical protein
MPPLDKCCIMHTWDTVLTSCATVSIAGQVVKLLEPMTTEHEHKPHVRAPALLRFVEGGKVLPLSSCGALFIRYVRFVRVTGRVTDMS